MDKTAIQKSKVRLTIGIQLYFAIAVFVALIFLAGFLGWNALHQMNGIQKTITQERIPELSSAIKIAQESVALMNSAPKLLAARSEAEVEKISALNQKNAQRLSEVIQQLKETHPDKDVFTLYESQAQRLTDKLNLLEGLTRESLEQKKKLNLLIKKSLNHAYNLNKELTTEVDEQTFFLSTGWKTLEQRQATPLVQRANNRFLNYYRNLLSLKAQSHVASGLLNQAVHLSSREFIQPLRERFRAALGNCKQSVEAMSKGPFRRKISPLLNNIEKIGLGTKENGIFSLLIEISQKEEKQKEYLADNQAAAQSLSQQTEVLIKDIKGLGAKSSQFFEEMVNKKKIQFMTLNIFSLILAFCTAFFLIGKFFVGRVRHLSETVLTMSQGDLEAPLKLKGNDEITDIGEAMEIFRRYALEVQKLNLVQKLAKEVQEKNKELEGTIGELKKAQKQIIMQEKLASLGQLTSGIAHEIKNPLNFINNFSKVSQELLEDLSRELEDESNNKIAQESRDFIEDILKDLHGNMEKIHTHGKRANDIITSMLKHSRGDTKGNKEIILLNPFINSCVNLAYQGKRAAGSQFNLDIKTNYNDDIKEMEINPQDISRIVLNLVTNACDALEEKQLSLEGEEKKAFSPCIWVSTKKENDFVALTIKDNGPGIPKEHIDKIFDPFFTTKSTDKGTGLGLSISHDIVLKHGGALKVERPDEGGSSFTVLLPATAQKSKPKEEEGSEHIPEKTDSDPPLSDGHP